MPPCIWELARAWRQSVTHAWHHHALPPPLCLRGVLSLIHGAATYSSSHCLGYSMGIAHPTFRHTRRANYKDDSTPPCDTPSRVSRLMLRPPSPSRLPFPLPPEGMTRSCQSGRWGLCGWSGTRRTAVLPRPLTHKVGAGVGGWAGLWGGGRTFNVRAELPPPPYYPVGAFEQPYTLDPSLPPSPFRHLQAAARHRPELQVCYRLPPRHVRLCLHCGGRWRRRGCGGPPGQHQEPRVHRMRRGPGVI